MKVSMKSFVFLAFSLGASAAYADQRWEVEGAFPAFPGQAGSTTAARVTAPALPVAAPSKAAPTDLSAINSCRYTVAFKTLNAVGQPCLTTAAFMKQLGLSKKAQARVEHRSVTLKAKTAH